MIWNFIVQAGIYIGSAIYSRNKARKAAKNQINQKFTNSNSSSVIASTIEGPYPNPSPTQGSEYGSHINEVWGGARGAGQIIWGTEPNIETYYDTKTYTTQQETTTNEQTGEREVTTNTHTHTDIYKDTYITYSTFTNYQLLLAKGEYQKPSRIWINNELLADFRPGKVSGAFSIPKNDHYEITIKRDGHDMTIRVYDGKQQNPDPLILEKLKQEEYPSHKGYQVAVVDNICLDKYGASIPNMEFEIVKKGLEPQNLKEYEFDNPQFTIPSTTSLSGATKAIYFNNEYNCYIAIQNHEDGCDVYRLFDEYNKTTNEYDLIFNEEDFKRLERNTNPSSPYSSSYGGSVKSKFINNPYTGSRFSYIAGTQNKYYRIDYENFIISNHRAYDVNQSNQWWTDRLFNLDYTTIAPVHLENFLITYELLNGKSIEPSNNDIILELSEEEQLLQEEEPLILFDNKGYTATFMGKYYFTDTNEYLFSVKTLDGDERFKTFYDPLGNTKKYSFFPLYGSRYCYRTLTLIQKKGNLQMTNGGTSLNNGGSGGLALNSFYKTEEDPNELYNIEQYSVGITPMPHDVCYTTTNSTEFILYYRNNIDVSIDTTDPDFYDDHQGDYYDPSVSNTDANAFGNDQAYFGKFQSKFLIDNDADIKDLIDIAYNNVKDQIVLKYTKSSLPTNTIRIGFFDCLKEEYSFIDINLGTNNVSEKIFFNTLSQALIMFYSDATSTYCVYIDLDDKKEYIEKLGTGVYDFINHNNYDNITYNSIEDSYSLIYSNNIDKINIVKLYPGRVKNDGSLVREIIDHYSQRSGLKINEYDLSKIPSDDNILGLNINDDSSAESIIKNISYTNNIVNFESQGKIKFKKLTNNNNDYIKLKERDITVKQFSSDDNFDDAELIVTRTQDNDLPRSVDINYPDPEFAYDTNSQTSYFINTNSKVIKNVDTPIVLNKERAKKLVEEDIYNAYQTRDSIKFSTNYNNYLLEPTDLVEFTYKDYFYRARIQTIERQNGIINIEAVSDDDTIEVDFDTADTYRPDQNIVVYADTNITLMDFPALTNNDLKDYGFYYIINKTNNSGKWQGSEVYEASNFSFTQDKEKISSIFNLGIKGNAFNFNNAFIDSEINETNIIDNFSEFKVRLSTDYELKSCTDDELLENFNICYVAGEILQFKNAELQIDGSFILSGFLRGRFSTKTFLTSQTINDNQPFILLNFINNELKSFNEIGVTKFYKAVNIEKYYKESNFVTAFKNYGMRAITNRLHNININLNGNNDFIINFDVIVRAGKLDAFNNENDIDGSNYELEIYSDSTYSTLIRNYSYNNLDNNQIIYDYNKNISDFTTFNNDIYCIVYKLNFDGLRGLPNQIRLKI